MNILSEEPEIFCNELDSWIKKISSQKSDKIFFTLYLILIDLIRSNFLNFEIVSDLERQVAKRKEKLNLTAQELCEKEWMMLWKHHPEWKFRRRLVEVRRLVVRPSTSTQPFIYQIVSLLNDLKADSEICIFLEKISSIFLHSNPANFHFEKKSLKMRNFKNYQTTFINHIRPFRQKLQKRNQLRIKQVNCFYEHSIEIGQLLDQLFIPGKTYIEQYHMLHHLAENDPIFLWDRINFLEKCFHSDATFSHMSNKKNKQPPTITNKQKWFAAIKKTEQEILSIAKMEFEAGNSPLLGPSKLNIEYQIHRNVFEKYLHELSSYIKKCVLPVQTLPYLHQESRVEINNNIIVNNHLYYKEEHITNVQNEILQFTVSSVMEESVINHAKGFWCIHPHAIHDEVYADYSQKYPQKSRLSMAYWGDIIRKRNLDPRPNSEKKRGKDKKPRQKGLC